MSSFTTLELLTPTGPVIRRVRAAPPRKPTADEMPIIDLSTIDQNKDARKSLAAEVKAAAQNTGFFYVRNHGIPEELIQSALNEVKGFFNQSQADKDRVGFERAGKSCGYHCVGSTQVNNTETRGMQHATSET